MGACTYSSVDELTKALIGQDGSYICIERQSGDDLTSAFLAKAEHLAERGTNALVVCVDEVARQCYLEKLADYPGISPENIVTLNTICLEMISREPVAKAIGRTARLLDENEHDVLLEDMKVSGLKSRRLREMLKFFFKSISECADEEEGWLITQEEQTVFSILQENLDVRRALLPCELASKAYQGMVKAGIESEALTLLVDDYGTLSKSSQRLIEFLAPEHLIIAGVTSEVPNTEEAYPFLEGFTNFGKRHHEASMIKLESTISCPTKSCLVHETPRDEFDSITNEVITKLESGVNASEILVAVPNSTWEKNIANRLTEKGFAVNQMASSKKIKGNPRFAERGEAIKRATFFKLFVDPSDLVALRSWLGLGDWLLRSDAFLELMAYSIDHNEGIREAIDELRAQAIDERPTKIFSKFDKPLDELEELMNACSDISRQDAIALFEQHGMSLDETMIASLGEDPQHADIQRLAEDALRPPIATPQSRNAVTVATYQRCHGRHAKILFMTGMVNGFLPAPDTWEDQYTIDHKNKALERDRRRFEDIESCASEEIVQSYFSQDLFENADAMNLQVSRIFIKNETRIARITPSEFVQ